jgi:hypothetical protein
MTPAELITVVNDGIDIAKNVAGDLSAAKVIWSVGGNTIGFVRQFFGKYQKENIDNISNLVRKKLENINSDRRTTPTPAILQPILEEACQENRIELQNIWASMMANALIDNSKKVKRDFINVIKQFDPVDVLILDIISKHLTTGGINEITETNAAISKMLESFGVDNDEFIVSRAKLIELKLIGLGNFNSCYLSSFGRLFLSACRVE